MQWSFSNNSLGRSQYLSFNGSQEVKPRMDSDHNFVAKGAQKGVMMDRSTGTNYTVSDYPLHHFSTHSGSQSLELMKFASSNQPNQGVTVPKSVVGVPVHPPVSVLPITGSVSYELRNGNKQHPGTPAQLTIFYAGSVNVFDDISPEKAQAVMQMARNFVPVAHHKAVLTPEASGPFKRPVTDEDLSLDRKCPPFLSLPGAVSVSCQADSLGKPICNLELASMKSTVPFKPTVVTQQEPPKVIHSLGSPSAPLFSTAALPQARKASLTRFLEKRKERASITAPYPVSKISPESSLS